MVDRRPRIPGGSSRSPATIVARFTSLRSRATVNLNPAFDVLRLIAGGSQPDGSSLPRARCGRRLDLNRQQSGGCRILPALRPNYRGQGALFRWGLAEGAGVLALPFWRPRISDCCFYDNRGGAGFGIGHRRSVAVRRGWPPKDCLDISPGQRPSAARRPMPIEIGHLPAGVRAIFRAGALRLESLVAPRTTGLEPSFHAVR
jgi:hypothetical protein